MRLPYAPNTPPESSPAETASIYARIAARRKPRPLIPLDLALLHSPPVADGWVCIVPSFSLLLMYSPLLGNNIPFFTSVQKSHDYARSQKLTNGTKNHLLGALRTQTIFPPALLELSICRVAVLNTAVYEWNAHAPLALKAGLAPQALTAAREWPVYSSSTPNSGSDSTTESAKESSLDEKEVAVLQYTDEMTLGIRVSDGVFEKLRKLFDEREIVELTAAVAGYNCVSRFLVALDVGENNAKEMKAVASLVEEFGGK